MQNKTNIKQKWSILYKVLKIVVPIGLAIVLYLKFFKNTQFSISLFIKQFRELPYFFYCLLFLASSINWFLETLKWQILINHLEKTSFFKSLKSVLSGVTVSQLLPFRTGEYIGRLCYVEDKNKINAALLSVFGSFSQLLMTLNIGIFGLIYLNLFALKTSILILIFCITIALNLLYFKPSLLRFKNRHPLLSAINESILLIDNKKTILIVYLISFLRYLSFLIPYALLSYYYQLSPEKSYIYFISASSCVFLFQTLSPNFILTDIAIRVTIPTLVFNGIQQQSYSGVDYLPGMILYSFNVMLPTVLGIYFFIKSKSN